MPGPSGQEAAVLAWVQLSKSSILHPQLREKGDETEPLITLRNLAQKRPRVSASSAKCRNPAAAQLPGWNIPISDCAGRDC
mmetsp:Transcript_76908/g.222307  ORF Transcript_76908/g.222307 Transcript_76908/m.222307 type:complete len:81 (+) Transcript_76908:229-471(+)